jgi:type I restriction enzyme, S subunit
VSAVLKAREPSARYLAALQPPLVEHFELVASAPGGVARLRELILTLAVRGKLVPQDPSDEPAAGLLERIRLAKTGPNAEPRTGRDREVVAVELSEWAYALPPGWAWARIGELGQVVGGGTPKSEVAEYWADEGIPWLTPADLYGRRERYISRGRRDISAKGLQASSAQLLPTGTVLFSSRAPIGYVAIAGRALATNQGFKSCVPHVEGLTEYLYWHLKQLARAINAAASGTTFKEVSGKEFANVVVALPPLTEQARIVSRIEELMRLCDALEENGRLEAAQHAQLLNTLLGALTDSASPEELATHWQRVAAHFDLLLDRVEAVDVLEQRITQLAVRGLLVHQDRTEAPATEFLRHIQAAQARSSAARKSEAETQDALLDRDRAPFEVPVGWTWVRFGAVVNVSGGVTLGRKTPIARPIVRPYLRVANVQRWRLDLTLMKNVTIDETELARFQLREGDLLITEGGDWDKVGRTAIWHDEIGGCLHQNHVFRARGLVDEWLPSWAELYLNSTVARSYFAGSAKQTTNLASINMTQLKGCPFPLPPIAEQRRIISRVTRLRRLCADLRDKLSNGQATRARLADALVESAVSPD